MEEEQTPGEEQTTGRHEDGEAIGLFEKPSTHGSWRPERMTAGRRLVHNHLASYLAHASRTNLDPNSTVAVGTRYEYTVQAALARLGLDLQHTGGRLDHGIDLLGRWRLPSRSAQHPLRVLVQCKALQSNTGPVLIRELEGAFAGAPLRFGRASSPEDETVDVDEPATDIMALLAATKSATKGIRDAMTRSGRPIAYMHMSQAGVLQQMIWNDRASEIGLQGMGTTTQFSPVPVERRQQQGGSSPTGLQREVVLTWQGEVWPTG